MTTTYIPAPVRRFLPLGGPRWTTPALAALSIALVVATGYFAYQRFFAPPPPAPTGQVVQVQRGTVASTVNTTGSVVATKQAKLVFGASGRIKDIDVAVGEQVKAGQVLARLVADSLQVKLDQAKSQLSVAQLKLQQLTEGATPEEIAAAQASYDAAMAKLTQVKSGATDADVRAAEASLIQARASYDQAAAKVQTLEAGSSAADLAAAQQGVESARGAVSAAQSKLLQLTMPTPDELAATQSSVDQARASLRQAQAKLDQARAGSSSAELASAQSAYDSALSSQAQAKANLDKARAAGNVPADVSTALSNMLAAAQAVRDHNDDTDTKLMVAQANINAANSSLKAAKTAQGNGPASGGTQASLDAAVDAAYVKLYQAQQDYETLSRNVETTGKQLQASYDAAVATYNQAKAFAPANLLAVQAAYDASTSSVQNAKIKLDQMKAANAELIGAQSAFESATSTLTSAEAKLHQMQYPRPEDVDAAQAGVDAANQQLAAAQAKLDALGVSAAGDLASARSSVDGARAAVTSAQAKLDQLRGGPTDADLTAAESQVAGAQATLAAKSGSAKASDIALQQEAVRQSELSVQQAQIDLDNATLTAPFDGTVGAISANVGEPAPSGTNGFLVLIDPRQVRVDVTVDETDVAKIQVGQSAVVTFDAVPGRTYVGKVIAVSPNGTTSQGVVTYPISLSIEPARFAAGSGTQGTASQARAGAAQAGGSSGQAAGAAARAGQAQGQAEAQGQPAIVLPAGLTASAVITITQKDDVLNVPLRAVRRQGREQVVEVVGPDGKTETRTVRTGVQSEQAVEILEGLNEGDRVLIPTTTTRAPTVGGGVPGGGVPGGGGGPQFVGR